MNNSAARNVSQKLTLDSLLGKYPELKPRQSRIAPLLKGPQDLDALAALLASAADTRRTLAAEFGDVLPALPSVIGSTTFAEVCGFVQGLIEDKQYLGSITSGMWMDGLKKVAAALPANLDGRLSWLAKLNRFADFLPAGIGWITTAEDASRVHAATAKVMGQSYGYSDRDLDLKRFLPRIFEWAARLVRNAGDFERLCAAAPALLDSLPETSEESPIGYIHSYDGSLIEKNAKEAADLAQFLKACGI